MSGKINIQKVTIKYIFILALLLHWLVGTNGIVRNLSYLVLFGLLILSGFNRFLKGQQEMSGEETLLLIAIAVWICFNLVLYGINYHGFVNVFFFLLSLFCIKFIAWISVKHRKILDSFFKGNGCLLLNLYFWVNIGIISIQNMIPGFFMTGYDPMYDNLTGMFGPGATHTITIYCAMLTCLNLEKLGQNCRKLTKAIYIFATLIAMAVTIQINDNTAFIVIFPVCVMLYAVKKYKWNLVHILGVMIIALLGVFILYHVNQELKEFIDGRFMSKVYSYIYFRNNGLTKTGFGDERIRAFEFTLLYGNSLRTGKGFCCNLDYVEGLENYHRFSKGVKTYVGISDLSGVSYLGGVWLYLLWCMILSVFILKIYTRDERKMSLERRITCFFLTLIFTVYTTIFRSIQMAILISMYAYVLGYAREEWNE